MSRMANGLPVGAVQFGLAHKLPLLAVWLHRSRLALVLQGLGSDCLHRWVLHAHAPHHCEGFSLGIILSKPFGHLIGMAASRFGSNRCSSMLACASNTNAFTHTRRDKTVPQLEGEVWALGASDLCVRTDSLSYLRLYCLLSRADCAVVDGF